ncbi:MAG: NAD(P)/FAD-dependent oxidoreductase [Burkholderiaceae bacterium]
MTDPIRYDAIVLGAGGAGLMCAAVAGQRGRRVLLIDHNREPGRKILISGGGRCNFTNSEVSPERFISANPHFAKSALKRYTPAHFVAMVERYGIDWHEKTLGQLFCDGSARQIVQMLLSECPDNQVDFQFGQPVTDLHAQPGRFSVSVGGQQYQAQALVIATGGPSIPKIGASGFAFELASQLGLCVVPIRPALVPLTLAGDDLLFQSLSGVATEVTASCGKARFREAALFTHRGLSGPAILQISSYWSASKVLGIDFLPDAPADWLVSEKASKPKVMLRNLLRAALPIRLADTLSDRLAGEADKNQAIIQDTNREIGNLPDKTLRRWQQRLGNWPFEPTGTEGYAKAEVTAGGVDTNELSSKDMQAKKIPGLYVVGEAVDVTGWLGGYNFHWAWASGWAAAQTI